MNSAHSGTHKSFCVSWMWRRPNSTWTSWSWAFSSLPCGCWHTLCSGTGSSLRDRAWLLPLLGRKAPVPALWGCFKLVDLGVGCWCSCPPLPRLLLRLAGCGLCLPASDLEVGLQPSHQGQESSQVDAVGSFFPTVSNTCMQRLLGGCCPPLLKAPSSVVCLGAPRFLGLDLQVIRLTPSGVPATLMLVNCYQVGAPGLGPGGVPRESHHGH